MPNWQEISRSIFGAWRLAHLDANGMHYFNLTLDGFFRSFLGPIIALPFFLLMVGLQTDAKSDLTLLLVANTLTYLIAWIAFVALMILFCYLLELGEHYVSFIIAYNWAQLIVIAVYLPLDTVIGLDLLGKQMSVILWLLGFAASCFYLWFIARIALRTTALIAVGLSLAEVLVGWIVQRGIELTF